MVKKRFVFGVSVFLSLTAFAFAQDTDRYDFKSSYGATVTYSPNSSHVLIGRAEGREITTIGFEYTHRLLEGRGIRLDYSGEVSPFYRESDPAIWGTKETYDGYTVTVNYPNPSRTIQSHVGIVEQDCTTFYPTCVPMYAIQGPNEITYGFAAAPLGVRTVLRPSQRVQPTFTVNTGFIITQRAIPIDGAAAFNYQFSLGPGVEIFTSRQSSFRVEYMFRHISNAGSANLNPGIDQGVFRFTFTRHY